MGATVTTGKLVAAFNNADGKTFYVLYEETYEKNVTPRTPRWGARAIGDLAAVMRIIFWSASSCEGGMLLGTGGRNITPEGYIAGWLKELENPVELDDFQFELSVSKGWSAVIGEDEFVKVKPQLEEVVGGAALAKALEDGQTVGASLYADSEALGVIFNGMHLGAWRILKNRCTPVHGMRNPALGYAPAKAKAFAVESPRFQKVNPTSDCILVTGDDGCWRCDGWAYSYVANYVTNLWESELQAPGSYRTRIKAYREAINSAPFIPSQGVKVVIDTTVTVESWEQSKIQQAVKELGASTKGSEIHIDVPNDYNQLYTVTRLPPACTKWVISDNAPTEQLSLLAS
ncbi:hypothetical protein [Pseudomonas amygdali]|uniref:hypothetical protein n=1 Tax=Pseudomonas amygdali TaxID=47877 RepID=UPI000C342C6E|nr:hypothetical protein [Pseudomonas amygdali]PWD01973.1 hypothetical protein CX658_18630 [Pseudomonas amygdali pv. lachrymans]